MNRFFLCRLLNRYDLKVVKHFSTKSINQTFETEIDIRKITKFSNILEQLRQTAPIFSSSDNELNDFNNKLKLIQSNEALLKKVDDYLDVEENYKRLLSTDNDILASKLFLSNVAALVYPDLNFWNREVSNEFLVEYTSALVLSLIEFAQRKNIINDEKVDKNKYSIVIARNLNHFLLEFERDKLLSIVGDYNHIYPTLCEVIRFILRFKSVGTIEYGFISTLKSTDVAIGTKYLNPVDLKLLEEADLYVSFDHIDELSEEMKSVKTYEDQLAYLTRQLYQSNLTNVANRWFNKSLQFVVILNQWSDKIYGNGLLIDRQSIPIATGLEIVDHSIDFLTKFKMSKAQDISVDQSLIKLHKLDFCQKEYEEVVKVAIADFAKSRYQKLVEKTIHYDVLHFTDYGQSYLESINLNADGWIQMALYKTLSMIMEMPISAIFRTSLEEDIRNFSDVQCFNREMAEYINDPMSEDKLRIASESNQLFNKLGKKGYSLLNILQKYSNHMSKILPDDEESIKLMQILKHNLTRRLIEPSITIESFSSRYAMSMVASNDFKGLKLPKDMNIHYNIAPNQILFTIVNYEDDDKENVKDKLTFFKQNLNECLRSVKEIVKS